MSDGGDDLFPRQDPPSSTDGAKLFLNSGNQGIDFLDPTPAILWRCFNIFDSQNTMDDFINLSPYGLDRMWKTVGPLCFAEIET